MKTLRELWFVARHIYLLGQMMPAMGWDPSWICANCKRTLRRDGTCASCDTRRDY